MIVKLLGVFDVFIAICFWIFGIFHILPERFIFILGIILIIKGVIFLFGLSIASFFDVIVGIVMMIASSVTVPHAVIVIAVLILIQKGIFSLL